MLAPGLRSSLDRFLSQDWVVRHNPVALFSAFCVLLGVYLITRGLGDLRDHAARLWLVASLEIYTVLLITGAAILHRVARQTRPAVILGLLALVFIVDPTFQTAGLATFETLPVLALLQWFLISGLGVFSLTWIFRLRISISGWGVVLATLAMIAVVPYVFESSRLLDENVLYLALWATMVLLVLGSLLRPRVSCSSTLSSEGKILLRWIRAGVTFAPACLALHLSAWGAQHSISESPAYTLPIFLLAPFLFRSPFPVWLGGAVALLYAMAMDGSFYRGGRALGWVDDEVMAWTLVGLFLLHSIRLSQPSLLIGAILTVEFVCFGGRVFARDPDLVGHALLVLGIFALVGIALLFRLHSAWFLAGAGLVHGLRNSLFEAMGEWTVVEWGALVLVVGIFSLPVAVAISWTHGRRPGDPPTGLPR